MTHRSSLYIEMYAAKDAMSVQLQHISIVT